MLCQAVCGIKLPPYREFFDFNDRDLTVALFIIGVVTPWWQRNKAFSLQGEENFSAGHVLEAAVGLLPVPLLTKNSGNMLPAPVPITVDSGLDRRNVFLGDGSFSDGKRQHFNCISERINGRQPKMDKGQKNMGEPESGCSGSFFGLETGVMLGSFNF